MDLITDYHRSSLMLHKKSREKQKKKLHRCKKNENFPSELISFHCIFITLCSKATNTFYLSSFFLSKWHVISMNFIIWSVKNSFERGMHNFLVGWHGWHSILINYLYHTNGILFPKLCWPSVRKICSCGSEIFLKFEAEGWEFAKFLSSLEQFIQTV